MDNLEKAERLRQTANVSFEEAKAALDACGGDLLDAVVLLEKQGKTAAPGKSVYSTSFQEQTEYANVPEKVEQQKQSAPTPGKSIGKIVRFVIDFLRRTSFCISRQGEEIFRLPSWLMVILVAFSWRVSLPGGLIALLFGIRYSFAGKADTDIPNSVLSKAGDVADDIRSGLGKKKE